MKCFFKNRQIEITEIYYASDAVDCHVMSAYFLDTGKDLTEDEILKLEKNVDLYDEWFEHQIERAESIYEGDR